MSRPGKIAEPYTCYLTDTRSNRAENALDCFVARFGQVFLESNGDGTNMGHVWTISFVINLSYKNKECYLLHKCSKRSRNDVRINAVCAGADGFATWISSSCGLKTFAPSNSQENEVFSFSCKVQLVMIYRSNNTRKCQMFLLH